MENVMRHILGAAARVAVAIGFVALVGHAQAYPTLIDRRINNQEKPVCELKSCKGADLKKLKAGVASAKDALIDPDSVKVLRAGLYAGDDVLVCFRDTIDGKMFGMIVNPDGTVFVGMDPNMADILVGVACTL